MAKKQRFDYFEVYTQLTQLAVKEANLLVKTFNDYTDAAALPPILDETHEIEHQGDLLNHAIFQNVATDFMPPIDREDIIDLSHHLDNILDYIEDVLQHMYMYDIRTMPGFALKMADIILKSCEGLDAAMPDFKNFKKSKDFRSHIVEVNSLEEQADRLYMEAMRHLHVEDNADPMHVIVWSRIYSRMEKCCDACEHAADAMATIVLKNS